MQVPWAVQSPRLHQISLGNLGFVEIGRKTLRPSRQQRSWATFFWVCLAFLRASVITGPKVFMSTEDSGGSFEGAMVSNNIGLAGHTALTRLAVMHQAAQTGDEESGQYVAGHDLKPEIGAHC
jgi:hypothetical protein